MSHLSTLAVDYLYGQYVGFPHLIERFLYKLLVHVRLEPANPKRSLSTHDSVVGWVLGNLQGKIM